MIKSRMPADRWSAALAGHVQADDDETRAAVALRQVLTRPEIVSPDPLDRNTRTRVMNDLQARGAFDPSGLTPAREWFRPVAPIAGIAVTGGARAVGLWRSLLGWAATLSVVAAAITVPLAWWQGQAIPQDAKTTLPLHSKGSSVAQTLRVNHPDAEAGRLGALLSLHGAVVGVEVDGPARLVTATLPTEQWAELETLLSQQGLSIAPGGRLAVRFVPRTR